MITEIGGTVGDIESLPFLEAIRQLYTDLTPKRAMFVHLTLVPYIHHAGEMKTKPTQHSVQELRRIGIQPHALICRSVTGLDRDIRQKIAHFASLPIDAVISGQDVDNVFKIPLMYRAEGLDGVHEDVHPLHGHRFERLRSGGGKQWRKRIRNTQVFKSIIDLCFDHYYHSKSINSIHNSYFQQQRSN